MTSKQHLVARFFLPSQRPHPLWQVSACLLAGLVGCQRGLLPSDSAASADAAQACPVAEQSPARYRVGEEGLGAAASSAPQPSRVVGTIALPHQLRAKVHTGDTIFVMARHAESNGIVAVTRMVVDTEAKWPLPFVLEDDRLAAGMSLRLSVRIDKDGDATTKQPGDLIGELSQLTVVPATAVRIDVSHIL